MLLHRESTPGKVAYLMGRKIDEDEYCTCNRPILQIPLLLAIPHIRKTMNALSVIQTMSTPLLRKGSAAGKGSRGRKGSAASKASRGSNGRKRAGTGGGKGKKKEWKLTAAALKEGVRTPNWAPQSNADLGIPEKSCQALICKDCQDLYLKEEEKRKIKKKETVVVDVTKEKIVTVS